MKQGWELKKLGELCNLSTGGTPSRSKPEYFSKGTIKWLVSGDIHKREIFDCDGRITEDAMKNSNAKFLPVNSVLIALNGQGKTRGTVALLRTEATCNQSLVSIYPKDIKIITSEYIYCYLHSKYDEIRKITGDGGNDRRGLNMPLIRSIEMPLPPLQEQQRIVSILDEAFANISKAKNNAEQNLKNAKELFESYLQSVFTNKDDDWEEKRLSDVCAKITDGTHQTPTYYPDGVIFLSSRNVTSGKIDWENIKYIDDKQHNEMHRRVAPRVNDILLAKNGTTGVAAIVDRDTTFDIYVSLALIRVLDEVLPHFMLYFINSPVAKKQFNKRLKGIGVPNLHLEEIREVIISFPKSVKEQKIIVKKLDELSAETKRLEAIYEQKLNDLEELKKSILQKAFNGEL